MPTMANTVDPTTGRPLPDSAIQRVLFVTSRVHVYQIPPLTSNRGFSASSWTAPSKPTAQQIFTARMRIFETSDGNKIRGDIVLEDPKTGDLFANVPYTSEAAVQQANDSSRFFAVRVVGEGGMKATLGIGFEERTEAFDFSIALSELNKVLGFGSAATGGSKKSEKVEEFVKRDFSLKEGESIHVEVGGRGRRTKAEASTGDESKALFSIAPPPSGRQENQAVSMLAPPPSAGQVRAQRSQSPQERRTHTQSAEELGFDDGEFGEFQ